MDARISLPELKPYPKREDAYSLNWWDVNLCSPDGAYFHTAPADPNKAQIIVVGPMKFAPVEYEMALNDLLPPEKYETPFFQIVSAEFLPGVGKGAQQTLRRGFVSMIFVRGGIVEPSNDELREEPSRE